MRLLVLDFRRPRLPAFDERCVLLSATCFGRCAQDPEAREEQGSTLQDKHEPLLYGYEATDQAR